MTVYINTTVIGDQQVFLSIKGFENRANDLTVPLKEARLTMLRSVKQNFEQSGRPIPWLSLAYSTLKQKLRLGRSPLPLIRTGDLKRSITGAIANQNRLIIGTAIKYARIHQRRNFSAKIPARPYLVFQDRDLVHIRKSLVNHLFGGKFRA